MNVWNTSPSPKPQPHLLPSITIISVLIGYNEPPIKTVLFRTNNNIEKAINTSTLVMMTSVLVLSILGKKYRYWVSKSIDTSWYRYRKVSTKKVSILGYRYFRYQVLKSRNANGVLSTVRNYELTNELINRFDIETRDE